MVSYRIINYGVGLTTLILFLGIIGVGYVYTNETRQAQHSLEQTQEFMNHTLTDILERQAQRWKADNIRFNATLSALGETYKEIQTLQRQADIDRVIELQRFNNITAAIENITNKNLNLTKFNRATLVDTNEIVRDLADDLNLTIDYRPR